MEVVIKYSAYIFQKAFSAFYHFCNILLHFTDDFFLAHT